MLLQNKHIFAIYIAGLTDLLKDYKPSDTIHLKDKILWNRITTILRLQENDLIIFFDSYNHIECKLIIAPTKHTVAAIIQKVTKNISLQPPIVLYQSLTKKSTFEEIAYAAGQLGITKLIPVITEKIHKNWFSQHDNTRLHAIMIAGCEQAKNFIIPTIEDPINLKKDFFIKNDAYTSILLDPQGELLTKMLTLNKNVTGYNVFLGPEGGLTDSEQKILTQNHDFLPSRLCQSILRSQDAALISLGLIRSF